MQRGHGDGGSRLSGRATGELGVWSTRAALMQRYRLNTRRDAWRSRFAVTACSTGRRERREVALAHGGRLDHRDVTSIADLEGAQSFCAQAAVGDGDVP